MSRDRVIDAAARVADRGGLAAVSMRSVGREASVEAMSLYHHVAGKEDLLDGLADWVFQGIELPAVESPWREAMTARAHSARSVLSRHPWALGLIESRHQPGPALLRHHDTVLGCLRQHGFPVPLATHAFSAIDAYVYGFVLTELNIPLEQGADAEPFASGLGLSADEYPHLVEMFTEQVAGGGFVFADEFDYGLDVILDGLEDRLSRWTA